MTFQQGGVARAIPAGRGLWRAGRRGFRPTDRKVQVADSKLDWMKSTRMGSNDWSGLMPSSSIKFQ